MPKPAKKRPISSSSEDEEEIESKKKQFKAATSNRKILKTPDPPPSGPNTDKDDSARKMDELIKEQILKFKPAKKKKRLSGTQYGDLILLRTP